VRWWTFGFLCHGVSLLSSVSRPALGPTHSPAQWAPGILSPGLNRCRGVTLTTHPHLVPRPRINRSYTFSPSWRLHSVAGRLYFYGISLLLPLLQLLLQIIIQFNSLF
jgi:hypothetical protein